MQAHAKNWWARRHKSRGGYPFSTVVRDFQSFPLPVLIPFGRSPTTLHLQICCPKQGKFNAKITVCFAETAPSNPGANSQTWNPASCASIWSNAVLQMETELALGGSAGCSSAPHPPTACYSTIMIMAKNMSILPTKTCRISRRERLSNPHGCSMVLTTRGDWRENLISYALWLCSMRLARWASKEAHHPAPTGCRLPKLYIAPLGIQNDVHWGGVEHNTRMRGCHRINEKLKISCSTSARKCMKNKPVCTKLSNWWVRRLRTKLGLTTLPFELSYGRHILGFHSLVLKHSQVSGLLKSLKTACRSDWLKEKACRSSGWTLSWKHWRVWRKLVQETGLCVAITRISATLECIVPEPIKTSVSSPYSSTSKSSTWRWAGGRLLGP